MRSIRSLPVYVGSAASQRSHVAMSMPAQPRSLRSLRISAPRVNAVEYKSPNRKAISPLSALEQMLRDVDDGKNGMLDREEFEEALLSVDENCSRHDIDHIFQSLCTQSEEISITKFITYVRHRTKSTRGLETPKLTFHAAFPDVLSHDDEDEDDAQVDTDVWGGAKMSAMRQMEKQLRAEAENDGVIDFPEFAAAMSNLGIHFEKRQLRLIFKHFVGAQPILTQTDGEHEVDVQFVMHLLGDVMEYYSHLQPQQMLKKALMELLTAADEKKKVDLDDDIALTSSEASGMESSEESGSPSRQRNLLRMGSDGRWDDEEVARQSLAMMSMMQSMSDANTSTGMYSPHSRSHGVDVFGAYR